MAQGPRGAYSTYNTVDMRHARRSTIQQKHIPLVVDCTVDCLTFGTVHRRGPEHGQDSSTSVEQCTGRGKRPRPPPPTVMPCRFNDTGKPHRASSFRTPQGIVRNESGLCLEDIDTLGSPASDQQRSCHDAQTQTGGGIMFMNGKTSTGSAVWWNVGFALCLVGVALSAPRWNWIFWVGALVYIVRALVIVAKSYSSSKKSGHSPDEHPC